MRPFLSCRRPDEPQATPALLLSRQHLQGQCVHIHAITRTFRKVKGAVHMPESSGLVLMLSPNLVVYLGLEPLHGLHHTAFKQPLLLRSERGRAKANTETIARKKKHQTRNLAKRRSCTSAWGGASPTSFQANRSRQVNHTFVSCGEKSHAENNSSCCCYAFCSRTEACTGWETERHTRDHGEAAESIVRSG